MLMLMFMLTKKFRTNPAAEGKDYKEEVEHPLIVDVDNNVVEVDNNS